MHRFEVLLLIDFSCFQNFRTVQYSSCNSSLILVYTFLTSGYVCENGENISKYDKNSILF